MSKHIPISILTPSKGMGHHIPGLIKNIDAQIGPYDEVILYFDGERPTNSLREFLGRYPYVRIIIGKINVGPAAGRNLLAKEAINPILRFQDADDLLAPFSLDQARSILGALENWQILVGGQLMYRNKVLHRVSLHNAEKRKQMLKALPEYNPLVVNLCYFNAACFKEVGGFDENIRFEEDWDLWLRYHKLYGDDAFTFTDRLLGIYNTYRQDDPHKLHIQPHIRSASREYIAKKHNVTPKDP
ncbi:MAG: glycosyltransferase family A protein [Pseudomonadales bacterium]